MASNEEKKRKCKDGGKKSKENGTMEITKKTNEKQKRWKEIKIRM